MTLAIIALWFGSIHAQTTFKLDSTELTVRVVKDSLDIPWEIIWGQDNHIWTTERFGRVSRIDPVSGKQHILLDISNNVYERSEAGMLGMVLHPDFSTTPHVFVAYTYLSGGNIRERLVKFNYDGNRLTPIDTLVEDIKGNTTHIGCRLIILPDNTLLMTTGDAQDRPLSQDSTSLVGKVLRMNLDGSIPADNPISGSLVWSIGHRNAQGLWRAPNGHIYSSEHGPTTDDELNILDAGRNYGWPTVAGYCDTPPENTFCASNNVVEPLAAWTPTIATSDIIWYAHSAIPEFKDKLLMTLLKDKSLIAFEFNSAGDQVVSQKKYFKGDVDRLRDICISPDGKIYLATNGASWSNNRPFTHSIIELKNATAPSEPGDSSASAIQDHEKTFEVLLAPNPLTRGQKFRVSFNEVNTATIIVTDMTGKLVFKKEVSNAVEVDPQLTKGVYLWRLEAADGLHSSGKLLIR